MFKGPSIFIRSLVKQKSAAFKLSARYFSGVAIPASHGPGTSEADGSFMKKNPELPIYFDYQSTTPLDPRVLDIMMPYLQENFGNPHSRSHAHGWEAEEAVERVPTFLVQTQCIYIICFYL